MAVVLFTAVILPLLSKVKAPVLIIGSLLPLLGLVWVFNNHYEYREHSDTELHCLRLRPSLIATAVLLP